VLRRTKRSKSPVSDALKLPRMACCDGMVGCAVAHDPSRGGCAANSARRASPHRLAGPKAWGCCAGAGPGAEGRNGPDVGLGAAREPSPCAPKYERKIYIAGKNGRLAV